MPGDAADLHPRAEKFGYTCMRCLRCCHDKLIQVDPYEIARLARRFGQTAAEFRAASTDDGAGNHLRRQADGACIFLGPEGCTVHSDRPLVCRLYPLGRHVDADGRERFSHVAPHPQSEGLYTREGTIGDFLEAQGTEPFIRAADRYAAWVRRAVRALDVPFDDIGAGRDDTAAAEAFDLVDMDAAIAAHCAAAGTAEPTGIEERTDLHLEILNDRIDALGK